jgi:hypothetical protein
MSVGARQAAVLRAIAAHDAEFSWGQHDCVTFALDVAEQLRGAPLMPRSWRSADEANDEIRARGGMHAAISAVLGDSYDPQVTRPADGDVVLVQAPGFEMAAVWAGRGPVGASTRGIVRIVPSRAVAAWRT